MFIDDTYILQEGYVAARPALAPGSAYRSHPDGLHARPQEDTQTVWGRGRTEDGKAEGCESVYNFGILQCFKIQWNLTIKVTHGTGQKSP